MPAEKPETDKNKYTHVHMLTPAEKPQQDKDVSGSTKVGPWEPVEVLLAEVDEKEPGCIIEESQALKASRRALNIMGAHDFLASFNIDVSKPD